MREKLSSMELAMMRKAAAMRRPIHGSLELTPLCNMNCDMCYIRLSPTEMAARGKLRTVNEWIALSEQMQRSGVLFLLLTGGVAYTVGAVLYGAGKKHRYMHSVFHLFCLGGSVGHIIAIWMIL